jgi:putative restriction endonuclease
VSRDIIFGDIEGFPEGYHFSDRKEMMPSSFHRNHGKGIDGNGSKGTSAIVLSGGYEDDQDHGDEIIYTGEGGNDTATGKQIKDQTWASPGNAGLLKSMNEALPVRVIRGFQHKSEYSPKSGYTHAGIYNVVDAWEEKGISDFKICRFRLVYGGDGAGHRTPEQVELSGAKGKKQRKEGVVVRIVRDTKISREVKKLYSGICQVCGTTIRTKSGGYSEGAHIRPLGRPHDGDDSSDNILSLCPNHHVMLDKGGISIADDLEILGDATGNLNVHQSHILDKANLAYHRGIHGYDSETV